jgi:hypothetical protein
MPQEIIIITYAGEWVYPSSFSDGYFKPQKNLNPYKLYKDTYSFNHTYLRVYLFIYFWLDAQEKKFLSNGMLIEHIHVDLSGVVQNN